MQLKTLIILALIAIISVGMAFFVVSKGYIPIGKQDKDAEVVQSEPEGNRDNVELSDTIEEIEEEEEKITGSSIVEAADKLPEIEIIPLDPIIVNLRGSFGRRYLKVTVNLGVKKDDPVDESDRKKKKQKDDEESVSAKEAVEAKLIEIRDILISLLSAKNIDDVGGWANQDIIRDEIKDVLNRKLQLDNAISRVFFTEFVIQ